MRCKSKYHLPFLVQCFDVKRRMSLPRKRVTPLHHRQRRLSRPLLHLRGGVSTDLRVVEALVFVSNALGNAERRI